MPYFYSENEFMALKIPDYETIPYSASLGCINGCSDSLGWGRKPESKAIGWCETPNGFMMVDECPVCFEKFRFHGTTTARNDLNEFRQDFELRYFLQNTK